MCICGVCMQNAQLGGNMYYIGVDLGTSAVKLLLMEESGKICNIVSRQPIPGGVSSNAFPDLISPITERNCCDSMTDTSSSS